MCNEVWEEPVPKLKANPFWIGVAPSHVAEAVGPMFAADAPWQEGLSGVDVFKYYGCQASGVKWATKLNVPDFVTFSKRNDLRIACEFGDFFVGSGKRLSDAAFARVKAQLDPVIAAGGTVSSINLDGPVCRTVMGMVKHPDAMELDSITGELVRFFALVRARYPKIQIGLIPNLPNWDYTAELPGYNGNNSDESGHTYLEVLDSLSRALQAAGDKIEFVEVDCPYTYYSKTKTRNGDAPINNGKKLLALQKWCEKNGAKFHLVINTEQNGALREDELGNQAFHDLVLEYIRDLRKDGVFPDGFLIQSWYGKPNKNLPETEAGTFTNTVRDAVRLINESYPYEKGTKKRSYQERSWAAGVGVERVAKSHTVPVYHSTPAETDQDIRWVQIDLGQSRTIDCIKLLPHPYHPSIGLASRGFPVRFKIELCNEESFQKPLLVYDRTQSDYPSPKDNICTFPGCGKQGRFIRLTATRLNQRLLELVKFEVYSKGVDIAEGRPVSDSHGGIHHEALTCPPRPQGERVVTDNPGDIIPHARWKLVQYKAVAPKRGVALGKGLFKTTVDNNHSKILDRACCYENFFLHLRPNSRPA